MAEEVVTYDDSFRRVIGQKQVSAVASGYSFTEGPVWSPTLQAVLFTDIPNNRILRWSETDGSETYIENSHFAIGLYFDRNERLISCEHTTRRLVRYPSIGDAGDPPETLADRYNGHVLNSPNDVVVRASDGAIFFTDPPFGVREEQGELIGYQHAMEYDGCGVFRVTRDPGAPEPVTTGIYRPNGLCFSADEGRLFVSDSSETDHRVYVLPVIGGEVRDEPAPFIDIDSGVPDGMRVDEQERIYVSTLEGVQVFNPEGNKIGLIPVPEMVTNICFGGSERNVLYITATSSLYRIELNTKGVQKP